MGVFELRNLVEAVLLAVPTLYLCIVLLPFSLTPKIVITLSVVVPLAGFGLIGINDDSLTRWLTVWWRWRRARRIRRAFPPAGSVRNTQRRLVIPHGGRRPASSTHPPKMLSVWSG